MSGSAAPPRLAALASAGGGPEKRTFHMLRKPAILFAPDRVLRKAAQPIKLPPIR